MANKVEICGVDTSTLPVISNERMRELFPLVHSGDSAAREEFIRGNLRLVLSILQRFHHRTENVDDLFQVGCIGLLKAVQNFDDTKMVRFSTYGVPMIAGEIRRYLPEDIGALSLCEAPPRFHARLSCTGKTYLYRLWYSSEPCVFERKYVWRRVGRLNVPEMEKAAAALCGRHDFAAFSTGRTAQWDSRTDTPSSNSSAASAMPT